MISLDHGLRTIVSGKLAGAPREEILCSDRAHEVRRVKEPATNSTLCLGCVIHSLARFQIVPISYNRDSRLTLGPNRNTPPLMPTRRDLGTVGAPLYGCDESTALLCRRNVFGIDQHVMA